MGPCLLARLRVGLCHIHRCRPTDLVGGRGVAVHFLRRLTVIVEIAHHRRNRAVGLQIDVFARGMRRPFDGLGRAGRWRPDRRMRLLIGARPHIDIVEVIEPPFERERPRLGPGLDHQVMRLLESRMRKGRVRSHRVVFSPDPTHHAGDQPAAGDAVEHGVLFGERQRMLAQTEGAAENGDLGGLDAPRQRRGRHDRRRHQPVGVLMVLVDRDAVEAKLGGKLQLVEIAVVERVALLRVEIAVRQHHPGSAILLVIAHVEIGIGHQVKDEDLHGTVPRMKPETMAANSSGRSACGSCPQAGIMVTVAPLIRSCKPVA